MTSAIFPYAVWQAHTTQNSIPANDNSLRSEIIHRAAKGIADAEPGTVADGDVYIVGAAWGAFAADDVVLFRGGSWYGYAPFDGWLKWVSADAYYKYAPGDGWVLQSFGGAVSAEGVSYDNSASGLDGADVQAALDELAARTSSIGSPVTALSIVSGVVNIDLSLGDYFTLLLTANVTNVTFSNLPPAGLGRSISIRIRQDGTGSRTFALPSSFKAISGSDTAVQSAANAYTALMATSFDQGTRWEYSIKGIAA